MNYIITKNKEYFEKIGNYNYCNLEDMILQDNLEIALDTETTGLQPRNCDIFCIQIGTGFHNYIIHMYDGNYEFQDIIPYINDKTLIGHNILFDLGFMYKYGFFPKRVLDTMLATKILYNGQMEQYTKDDGSTVFIPYKADFGSCMKRELGVIYDKTDQKNIHIVKLSQQSTIEYSFNDVDRLIELHDTLMVKIEKGGFKETYELHCRFIRALAYMEQCGLPISSEKWKAKMNIDFEKAKLGKVEVEEFIFDALPQYRDTQLDMFDEVKRIHCSPTSPLQMLRVFEALEIPTKDKDGKDSINAKIIEKSKHEFVPVWVNYQNANHRVTTFGDTIYKQIDKERIFTNFNPMVDTARLSTRKGQINFLNFPADKDTRYCFVANPGNVMIVCDYSGQETVVAADLSGDIAMTKSVIDGDCLHCAFARILNPELKDLDDETIIKDHKQKRQDAKAPRFAFQYGGSAYTIHQDKGIPLAEAYKIEEAFKELHAGLYTWGEKEFNKAIKVGYIESADGWKLALPMFDLYKKYGEAVSRITRDEWTMYSAGKKEYVKYKESLEINKKDKDKPIYGIQFPNNVEVYKKHRKSVSDYFKLRGTYQRLCLNNPVQSRSAMMTKKALYLMFEWIEDNNLLNIVKIVNAVHDEIILECPNILAQMVSDKLGEIMVLAGNSYLTNLTIKADSSFGASWGEAKH
jgi:DNA polymerase-1